MVNSNAGILCAVAKNVRKRKMKEVAEPSNNPFNLQGQQFLFPPQQQVSKGLPFELFGQSSLQDKFDMNLPYTPQKSLLTADDEHAFVHSIDHVVKTYNDQLRHTLADMGRKHYAMLANMAEERSEKRLKEKQAEVDEKEHKRAELEAELARKEMEVHALMGRVESLQQVVISLRCALQEATQRLGGPHQMQQEEVESSSVGPSRMDPVRLECKKCENNLATMMLWPCNHLCLCTHCYIDNKICPICSAITRSVTHVKLPFN